MTSPAVKGKLLMLHLPNTWSPMKRFHTYCHDEYPTSMQTSVLINSIQTRFDMIQILWAHYNEMKPKRSIEDKILKEEGHVFPTISYLMTANFESILNQFYSINDNMARILHNLFPENNRPPTRMSKLIRNVDNTDLPDHLKEIIKKHNSYKDLRDIRTESAHFSTGIICSTEPIAYLSGKAGPTSNIAGNALQIDDIEKFYEEQWKENNIFINAIFTYLESTLTNNHQAVRVCGFLKGLVYQRIEGYQDWKTGKEGTCTPIWEENSDADPCPGIKYCRAYKNHINK